MDQNKNLKRKMDLEIKQEQPDNHPMNGQLYAFRSQTLMIVSSILNGR